MFHFFAPEENAETGSVAIRGSDVNHIRNVLRLKAGDRIVVSDGRDRDSVCEIVSLAPDEVLTRVLPEAVEESELPVHFHLFQGLPKGDKMEFILQKAVELGVSSLIPVEMKRCVVKLDEKKKLSRREKWAAQAESAAKQSGRRIIPEIEPVMSFREALGRAGEMDVLLVPYENAEGMDRTRELLSSLKAGQHVGIFIGPEGGFEPSEIEALTAAGGETLTLGRRILRTETAGMAALAMGVLMTEN